MYCKNCGKVLEDETKDLCADCEAAKNTEVVEEKVEVVKEVNNDNNNTNNSSNQNVNNNNNVVRKSKTAAGVLGILLGSFGVHNFYLGYTGKAVAQLLITVLTCGIGACATSIWGLIEGILILTGSINVDGNGVPLGD
ncbi:MAG: TM2 domain-containing protein [Clostridia bacterium]|nr:TM2 domain-containing protein [Clostridia bacterium]